MPRSVCLDTNVWSWLADDGQAAVAAVEAVVRQHHARLAVPPAIILEAAQTPHAAVRNRILAAITGGTRIHMRTEVDLECAEFVSEVRRLRPEWIRPAPAVQELAELRRFWTKDLPRIARRRPDRLAAAPISDEGVRDHILSAQRWSQESYRAAGGRAFVDMHSHEVRDLAEPGIPPAFRQGWDGAPVATWRLVTSAVYWQALVEVFRHGSVVGEDTTFADWTCAYVRCGELAVNRRSFNQLWYREVSEERMCRNWLRWAVNMAQLQRRIGDGNPTDEQLSAYLLDVDVFITGDKRFAEMASFVVHQSPVQGARIAYVRRNDLSAQIDRLLLEDSASAN